MTDTIAEWAMERAQAVLDDINLNDASACPAIATALLAVQRETREQDAKVAAQRAKEWLVGQPMETRRDAPPDIAKAIRSLSDEVQDDR